MANRSDLARRISAVLDPTQRRGRVGLLAAASTLAAAGLVVLAIAPLHAVAQVGEDQQSGSTAERRQTRRSSPLDRALYEAAESGDVSDIDRLLNAGANINCALWGDGSPLIGAAREGHLPAVRLLLDRGADPNMPVQGDGNPLIMAARKGHAAVVTLLLDRGARIADVVRGDENALIQASSSGQLAVVKLLVSRGANVNARVWAEQSHLPGGGEWRSPLSMAQKGRQAEVVGYLLSVGARE
jgi:ankyrin repeat protein